MSEAVNSTDELVLLNDEPLSAGRGDRFRRKPLAQRIALLVETMAAGQESTVLALVGTWGSGKSSLVDMVRTDLGTRSAVRPVEFNPWLVGSVDELVRDFFATIAEGLSTGAADSAASRAREAVANYGKSVAPLLKLLPLPGASAASALMGFAANLAGDRSLMSLRAEAAKELRESKTRTVVVMDDLDRLQPDELLLVFKLIRLVGRLPHIHYLLAFDEATVADVLKSTPLASGDHARALKYLDKIVQVRIDMPPLYASDVDALANDALDAAMTRCGVAMTEDQRRRFGEVYRRILGPRLKQPRQIKRLFAQVEATLPLVLGEVDVTDFIVLTYIRVTHPSLYAKVADHGAELSDSLHALVTGRNRSQEERLAHWKSFADVEGVDPDDVLPLLAELFEPVAGAFAKTLGRTDVLSANRRIAAQEYFDRYFQLGIPPDDVSDRKVRSAVEVIAGGGAGRDVRWLAEVLIDRGSLVLSKMEAAWPSPGVEGDDALVAFLAGHYAQLRAMRLGILGPDERIEIWVTRLLVDRPVDAVGALVEQILEVDEGDRLATRALVLAAGITDVEAGPAVAAGSAVMVPYLQSRLEAATSGPVDADEDLVWLLRDATSYADRATIRGWIDRVLDETAWTTEDFVGCFTPLAYMTGSNVPRLSSFAADALVDLMPLDEVIRRLGPVLDDDRLLDVKRPDPFGGDTDVAFARRRLMAHASLRHLRDGGGDEPELAAAHVLAFGPSAYCAPEAGDLHLRVVAGWPQLIEPQPAQVGSAGVEGREVAVRRAVDASDFTRWLVAQRDVWHWEGDPGWELVGSAPSDAVQLEFKPSWAPGKRPSLRVRFASGAGQTAYGPYARVEVDVTLNLLELDEARHHASVRSATTPPPAPGALRPGELVEILSAMVDAAGALAFDESGAPAESLRNGPGELGVWVVPTGHPMDRFLRIGHLGRVAGTADGNWVRQASLPFPKPLWEEPPSRALVLGVLRSMLVGAGYREVNQLITELRTD